MGFDREYQKFIDAHCGLQSEERSARIRGGLGHAEHKFLKAIWWPMFHHFDNLHPEYEIRDYKEGYRYIDFAYIEPNFRVGIEIDGFGPHWRNISKWQFAEHWHRQNSLAIDGWYVLRFAYHDLDENPRVCQQTIQQLLGRWQKIASMMTALSAEEREVIRLATRSLDPLSPVDVSKFLNVSTKSGRKILHRLLEDGWLEPVSGDIRITSYQLHPSKANLKW